MCGVLAFGGLGRKRLFTVTLPIRMAATIATEVSWDFWSFLLSRAVTGAAIGGEYAVIHSAILEPIRARRRGTSELAINGAFWDGGA